MPRPSGKGLESPMLVSRAGAVADWFSTGSNTAVHVS